MARRHALPRPPCRWSALGLGSVAGLGAARLAASHYSVMVKDTSQVFVAGPPVVERIGQKIGKNDLGGSQIHTRNGVVDDEALSEPDAFERVRRFLSYLPSSVHELPPRADANRGNPADQAIAAQRDSGEPACRLQDPQHRRDAGRRGILLRDRPVLGQGQRNRPRAHRRLAGDGGGQRSVPLRRRVGSPDLGKDQPHGRSSRSSFICRCCTWSTFRAFASAWRPRSRA